MQYFKDAVCRLASIVRLHRAQLVFGAVVLAVIVLLFAVVAPWMGGFVEGWGRRDVELRARIINASAREQVERLLGDSSADARERLEMFFAEIAADERLVGIGICNRSGTLGVATEAFPTGLSCNDVVREEDAEVVTPVLLADRTLLAASFPLSHQEFGHLVVVHDLNYALSRAGQAQLYLSLALAIVVVLATAAAAIVSSILLRSWREALRGTLADLRAGRNEGAATTNTSRELREALDQYDLSRRTIDGIHVDWSPETLKNVLSSELPGAEIIAVSNREPYIHNREDAGIRLQIPASGLVAALEPVVRACGGTWIAHGSGSADREMTDAQDRLRVPPSDPSYTLRRVWLTAEEQDGYYYGLANEGIWPLCHIAFVRPTFREDDWQAYKAVNAKFADAVVAEARRPDPIVLIQDYHFALVPRMLRRLLPRATTIAFWHIPWPNAETFSICPWKEDIIEGLLGSSILGFHTQFHCNNFLETVDRFVESRIDREHRSVIHRDQETLVRPYPISIEWPPAALTKQKPVANCRGDVRRRFGIAENVKLGVGIERFDYTKGILDRIRAIDALLQRYPAWVGRATFLQGVAPTRSKLSAYQSLQNEAIALAQEVNARHAQAGWEPIVLSIRHHEPDEVFEFYRAADFCVVSSLHDGMNLVAKEFAAARDDESGVLILSTFAGASRELNEALIVNPYHTHQMAEAMHLALSMPATEQQARMRQMRASVRSRNVYRWAGQMLLDAASLRRRAEIEALAASHALKRMRHTDSFGTEMRFAQRRP